MDAAPLRRRLHGPACFWAHLRFRYKKACFHKLQMDDRLKYARVEWERRFLLEKLPEDVQVNRIRQIADLYIEGACLRLRQARDDSGQMQFKLTQKLAESALGARQGLITTMYLTRPEFDVLAKLPGRSLRKTRFSLPPFGIDIFEGELQGLVLAEAEFSAGEEACELVLPAFIRHEVTNDARFTGGNLVKAARADVANWLAEYGMGLNPFPTVPEDPRGTLDL